MESTLKLGSTVTQAFCSIPSCLFLFSPESTAFHLPSTGMLVCSVCYKLYLKSEYEKVIAAERLAVNEKSECDSPLPESCKSSVGNNSAAVSELNEDLMEIESSDEQASPNISEDTVEECPVQLDLENPDNKTQITQENIIQEPPKPKETCEKCLEPIWRKPIMFVKSGVRTKLCHDCYKIVRFVPQSEEPVGQEVAASRSKKCTTCNKSQKRKRKVFAGQQKNKLRTHPETGELTCRGCLIKYYRNKKQKEKMFGRVPNTDNSQEDTLQGDNHEEQIYDRQETEQNTPCASSSQECESKSLSNVSSASPTTIPNTISSDYSNHIEPVNHIHGTQWHLSDIYRSQQLKDSQEYNSDHNPNSIRSNHYQEPTKTIKSFMDKREKYHLTNSAETVSYTTLEAVPSISSSFVRKDLEHFGDNYNYEKLNDDNFSDQPEKDTQVDNSCPIACDFQSESIQTQPDEEENKEISPKKEKCANTFCKQPLIKSVPHPLTKRKVCHACYYYYKRNGRDREEIRTIGRNEQHKITCANTFCKKLLHPKYFRPHPATKTKICYSCYYYYKKHGRNREVITTHRRREKHETNCTNTFCRRTLLRGRINTHPVTKEKICKTCYNYYSRNGRDREVIVTKRRRENHETSPCYDYFKRNGRNREVVAGKVKKCNRDRYESESDTTSISSEDSSIEESSESDCESDSFEMDFE